MWYVVWVKTGAEEKTMQVCRKLIANGQTQKDTECYAVDGVFENGENVIQGDKIIFEECFLPMKEIAWHTKHGWEMRKKILFPGYIFFIAEDAVALHIALKTVPEFTKLLANEDGPIPLLPHEEDFLRKYTNKERVIEMSTGELIGGTLTVISGPMTNYQGKVTHIDRRKRECTLQMELFGRITEVKLGLDVVKKLP